MRLMHWLGVLALCGFVAGCDALFTGEKVAIFDLAPQADGGYAPLVVTLGPELGRVALNLRADLPVNPASMGKWNDYLVLLTFRGAPIATHSARVNYTGTADAPGALSVAQTLMTFSPAETGDYTFTISVNGQAAVALAKPQLELRKNIADPR